MKLTLKIIVILGLAIRPLLAFSQDKPIIGYRIENGDVVFTFDRRDYKEVTDDNFGPKRSFENIEINRVAVAGEFNDWSKKKWRMRKIDDNIFELRKNINDFSDAFSWEFKYVINDAYWVEPTKNISNLAKSTMGWPKLRNVYNLKLYLAYPDENGNSCFRLNGYDNAKHVAVAGSFNKWNEDLFKMRKVDGGWELKVNINPGEYEYRYIVDGQWIEDPSNPNKTPNEFGEFNSIIDIKKLITFFLPNYNEAKNVVLSGSFNNWDTEALPMKRVEEGWTHSIHLSGGKHHYKFIVDGKWILDPENPVREYDQSSRINSVYMVR